MTYSKSLLTHSFGITTVFAAVLCGTGLAAAEESSERALPVFSSLEDALNSRWIHWEIDQGREAWAEAMARVARERQQLRLNPATDAQIDTDSGLSQQTVQAKDSLSAPRYVPQPQLPEVVDEDMQNLLRNVNQGMRRAEQNPRRSEFDRLNDRSAPPIHLKGRRPQHSPVSSAPRDSNVSGKRSDEKTDFKVENRQLETNWDIFQPASPPENRGEGKPSRVAPR